MAAAPQSMELETIDKVLEDRFSQSLPLRSRKRRRRLLPASCRPSQCVGAVIGVTLCIIFSQIEFDEEYPKSNDMFAVTCLIACVWIFESLPLPVGALLPVVLLPAFDIMPSAETSRSYGHWLIMMFVGAFIVDGAIVHVGLHKRVALATLNRVGTKPWVVLATFMGLSWLLSMFCSNTATSVMLVPFATGILDTIKTQTKAAAPGSASVREGSKKLEDAHNFSLGVLLGVCYGATIGGVATIIGTPPNGIVQAQSIVAGQVHFANWFAFAFPVSLCLLILAYLVLYSLLVRGCARCPEKCACSNVRAAQPQALTGRYWAQTPRSDRQSHVFPPTMLPSTTARLRALLDAPGATSSSTAPS